MAKPCSIWSSEPCLYRCDRYRCDKAGPIVDGPCWIMRCLTGVKRSWIRRRDGRGLWHGDGPGPDDLSWWPCGRGNRGYERASSCWAGMYVSCRFLKNCPETIDYVWDSAVPGQQGCAGKKSANSIGIAWCVQLDICCLVSAPAVARYGGYLVSAIHDSSHFIHRECTVGAEKFFGQKPAKLLGQIHHMTPNYLIIKNKKLVLEWGKSALFCG